MDRLVRQLEAAKVRVEFLNLSSAWQFSRAVRRLTRLLREQQPQIVQTFLFHANIVGTLAASRADVPHVVAGIRVADPRRWRSWIERRVTRRASRIVCVSQSVADSCHERGYDPRTLVVIPNGVELARFQNAPPADLTSLGVPPGKRAILYVGRLDAQKGLDDFLRAGSEVLAAPSAGQNLLPGHDLLLVGDGPKRQELEQLASSLGIAERIHFAGWQENVPGILAAAELLVLPSRWEGMPNVVLEAMAASKPVVATRAEGVVELLGAAADSQTVPIGDASGAWKLICQFSQSPQIASDLARKNQSRAETTFSLAAMTAEYDRLYTRLVAAGSQNLS
jgi:glycosyltransferase involved in cell wall biosynthesis